MSYPSAPRRAYQIDVVDQVGRAYRAVIGQLQLVAEMALLPYLIVLGTELIAMLMPGGIFGGILAGLVHAIGFLIFGSVFMVRWHRFVLLGERVGDGLIPPGWWDFVLAELKLGAILVVGWVVLVFVAALPPHILTMLVGSAGGIALTLFALRVSLIFPAAAVAQPVGLRTAWDWVEGNFWRFFACALLTYIPFLVAELLIGGIGGLFPSLLRIVFAALQLVLSFAGVAVMAALLSHLYRDIGANNPVP
jgi:hypothetical protein